MARVFGVTANPNQGLVFLNPNPNQFFGDTILQKFHQLAVLELSLMFSIFKAIKRKKVQSWRG
jgi:hypothetical protein